MLFYSFNAAAGTDHRNRKREYSYYRKDRPTKQYCDDYFTSRSGSVTIAGLLEAQPGSVISIPVNPLHMIAEEIRHLKVIK